jgi:[protein-PII] uridylyltransferase
MADLATRRDLSDASVADNVAATAAGDAERLRLLYLLTIGDSRATGPAAWSPSKAALVRDLFVKAGAAIERGETRALAADRRQLLGDAIGDERANAFLSRLPESYVLAFEPEQMRSHEELLAKAPVVQCDLDDGRVTVTVAARDRPRLLATLAGALAVCGLDVLEANLFGTTDGLALDVFRAADPFGRLEAGTVTLEHTIEDALAGSIDLPARVDERRKAYAVESAEPGPAHIEVDIGASETDTVLEVHVDDDVGLLFRLASALADLGLDVRVAKAATLGERVVDVFYVRDAEGNKIEDVAAVNLIRAALTSCVTR